MELEAARASTEQGDGEAVRAASASARVVELEEAIEGLVAEVDALSHGHGAELGMLEAALRERGRITHALEQELGRRERIILDLVQALEEARTGTGGALPVGDRPAAVAASPDLEASLRDLSRRFERARGENEELRQKLDGASLEIARREAEITTTSWRIQELEEQVKRLEDEQSELTMTIPPPGFLNLEREANDVTVLTQRLTSAEDELDLLRQALAQEHDARVRAESGETLERARAEAARQAALVDELTRQIEAQGGPGPNGGGPDDTATGAAG
jgi:DNA repair exonuclease SbcCD ATPase subunit